MTLEEHRALYNLVVRMWTLVKDINECRAMTCGDHTLLDHLTEAERHLRAVHSAVLPVVCTAERAKGNRQWDIERGCYRD